jgi:hypothetical protein
VQADVQTSASQQRIRLISETVARVRERRSAPLARAITAAAAHLHGHGAVSASLRSTHTQEQDGLRSRANADARNSRNAQARLPRGAQTIVPAHAYANRVPRLGAWCV